MLQLLRSVRTFCRMLPFRWKNEEVNRKKDFIVHFDFAKNDFFTNERLSKKYIFGKDDVKEAEPTEINWFSEDKNHTKRN